MNSAEPSAAEAHSNNKQAQDVVRQFTSLIRYLDLCRQQRILVTYLEVADAIDMPVPHRIHKVTLLLEALMEHDYENDQPQHAALVVSRNRSGLPAKGFFLKAQALGLMQTANDEDFHKQCLDRLFGRK
jgi:hypothetical protein